MVRNSKSQQTYKLTPSRKAVGKAIARKSMKKVADQCLSNHRSREYALQNIRKTVLKEMRDIATSDSIFGNKSVGELKEFQWEKILQEILKLAPTFGSILISATKTRKPRSNQFAVISLCFGIILKYRCQRLNFVQRIQGLIIYASHCPKKV